MKWAVTPFASQSRRADSPALASISTIETSQPRAASTSATSRPSPSPHPSRQRRSCLPYPYPLFQPASWRGFRGRDAESHSIRLSTLFRPRKAYGSVIIRR